MAESTYTITYFNGRGRAEISRYILADAGIEWNDVRCGVDGAPEWPDVKPTTTWGQLPMLTDGDFSVSQSTAMERYLAKKTGIYGADEQAQATCDSIVDTVTEIVDVTVGLAAADDEKKAKNTEKLNGWWTALSELLGEQDYIMGEFSWADLRLQRVYERISNGPNKGFVEAFDNLKAHSARVLAREGIAAWVAKRPESAF